MALFNEIAKLADLSFDAEVQLEHSQDVDRGALRVLFDAGLCPDRATLTSIHPAASQCDLPYGEDGHAKGQAPFPTNISILDKLGEYRSDKRKIVIFDVMCQIAAAALDIDAVSLRAVVEAHETAHAVTHLGKDTQQAIWENFAIAETEDKELFAQLYALYHLRAVEDESGLTVFMSLAEHQDARYNSWRSYDNESLLEVNRLLLEARRKQPPDFIVQRSFMGYGINMFRSASDVQGNAMVLGDGRVFYGMDWGLGFSRGEQAPGRVSSATLAELRCAIEDSGILRIADQTFGPEYFMDGGVTNLSITFGTRKRRWQANCGQWGRHESIFGRIERLFRKAVTEASVPSGEKHGV